MRALVLAALIAAAPLTSAHAELFTFEGNSAGDIITGFTALGDGPDATVAVVGGSAQAMVFDTQNFTGQDADLSFPNDNLGKVLIISEDGDSSDPDDNASGGMITIDFIGLANINDFTIVDIDRGETATFDFFFANNTSLQVIIPGSDVGNGQFRQFSSLVGAGILDSLKNVTSFKTTLSGSGAFDNYDFTQVPTPATLPLLFAGLGGLLFARRRKKA